MNVTVTFDPCALREHRWRRPSYGLGLMFGAETCSRCGETRYPDDSKLGGIDRSENPHWRNVEVG